MFLSVTVILLESQQWRLSFSLEPNTKPSSLARTFITARARSAERLKGIVRTNYLPVPSINCTLTSRPPLQMLSDAVKEELRRGASVESAEFQTRRET